MSGGSETFHWGVSTAAYQIEGDPGSRGAVLWDAFLAAGKGSRGDTGAIAADHLRHLDADLDLLVALGVTAYRFSVSWARVMPDGRTVSPHGLDVYRRLVDGLLARGITPAATLYHNDPPVSATDGQGWAGRDVAWRFAEYAGAVAGALGDRVSWWMTVNEPFYEAWLGYHEGAWPPERRSDAAAVAALHHLLLGHGAAVGAIRAATPGPAAIGLANSHAPCVAARPVEEDRRAAARVDAHTNRLVLDPVLTGAYPAEVAPLLGERLAQVVRDGDLALISTPIDFLGVNYYHRRHVADAAGARDPELLARSAATEESYRLGYLEALGAVEVVPRDAPRTMMGMAVEPAGLADALLEVAGRYGPLRLYVTETGLPAGDYLSPEGTVDDGERTAFLDGHVAALRAARHAGVDVGGLFVWSLLDNLEWNLGYGPRFGLVYVEFASQRRVPKRSFGWYRDLIARSRGATGEAGRDGGAPPEIEERSGR